MRHVMYIFFTNPSALPIKICKWIFLTIFFLRVEMAKARDDNKIGMGLAGRGGGRGGGDAGGGRGGGDRGRSGDDR